MRHLIKGELRRLKTNKSLQQLTILRANGTKVLNQFLAHFFTLSISNF